MTLSVKTYTHECYCLESEITTRQVGPRKWTTKDAHSLAPNCGHGIHEKCFKKLIDSYNQQDLPFHCPWCRRNNVKWISHHHLEQVFPGYRKKVVINMPDVYPDNQSQGSGLWLDCGLLTAVVYTIKYLCDF